MSAAHSITISSPPELDAFETGGSTTLTDAKRARLEDDVSALYATWFDRVLRWVGDLGVRSCDRQDVAQSVFVVVHRRLPDFDLRNVGGWLYRITTNQVRDYRSQLWNRAFFKGHERGYRGQAKGYEPLLNAIPSPAPTPVALLETKEARRVLDGALSGLSEATRATFVLFDVEGFTCEEIAALHRVVRNTVWARLRRARQQVGARLLAWRETERMAG